MDVKRAMFPTETEERVAARVGSVLFVDPGRDGTGWAHYAALHAAPKKTCPPLACGVLNVSKRERWENATWTIAQEFAGVLAATAPDWVVLEYPELFSGSAVSQAAAARGDLGKLWYLCGMLGLRAGDATGKIPVLVTPREWKGQLPKEAVDARVQRAYGWRDGHEWLADHVGDAVGMGLAAQVGL